VQKYRAESQDRLKQFINAEQEGKKVVADTEKENLATPFPP